MRSLFFACLCLLCSAVSVVAADQVPLVSIAEVYSDPAGSDTGAEIVVLWNQESFPVDLGGWTLDADLLPPLTFPQGTQMAAKGVLRVYLRRDGVSNIHEYFTGSSFGSSNMGNIRGAVTLFRPGPLDAVTIQDYVPWGDGSVAHGTMATAAGLWNGPYPTGAQEGTSLQRICPLQESACFSYKVPPFVSLTEVVQTSSGQQITQTGSTMSGDTLEELPPEEQPLAPPVLALSFVHPVEATGTADRIGLYVRDDGTGGAGRPLPPMTLRVDSQRFSLEGLVVRSGDQIQISLGNGTPVQFPDATISLTWSENKGLVSTTEQVFLEDEEGRLIDGVCWYKEPVPASEMEDISLLASVWTGPCLSSVSWTSGGRVVRRLYTLGASLLSWEYLSPTIAQTPALPAPTPDVPPLTPVSPCVPVEDAIHISEILPNPEGVDAGNEWIELVNTKDEAVDLCGLSVDDGEGGSPPFGLTGIRMEPRGFLLLKDSQTGISLGNTVDTVRLLDDHGSVLESISYGEARTGKSYSKLDDTF